METITFDKRNYRKHSDENKRVIKKSLKELGAGRSVLIDKNNTLIAGNGVFEQAQALGIPVRVIDTDGTELIAVKRTDIAEGDEKRKRLALADNVASDLSDFDDDLLHEDFSMEELNDWGLESEEEANKGMDNPNRSPGKLMDRFIVPPFSVLDARKGYWIERKRMWNKEIGDNAQARGEAECYHTEYMNRLYGTHFKSVSVLDPVLSEIVLHWFAPESGSVFDCFAGDTVFGYVAGKLGYNFTGIELRKEQVDFNTEKTSGLSCRYICDDGRNVRNHIEPNSQDMLFSCPPYYNLEKYSDLPNDASNQGTYEDYLSLIDEAFANSIECLKDGRFAVIVCSDIRDKQGYYRGLPKDIKRIFESRGMRLYNELILIDPIASHVYTCSHSMKLRKVDKVHQNVLVFYRGNIQDIKKNKYKEIKYEGADLELFGMVSDE